MAEVGNLQVKLIADSDKFHKAISEAVSDMGQLGGSIGSVVSSIGPLGIAIGVVATGIMASLASYEKLIDETKKLKGATGATTEEASKFASVAGLLGVSADSLASSFNKMSRSISNQPELFKKMGVNVDGVGKNGKDLIDVFYDVNKVINSQGDAATRNALAMKIYGMSYTEIASLAKLSKNQIAELEKQVGMVVSDEDIKKMKEYKLNVAMLKDNFIDLGNTIGQAVVPVLNDLTMGFNALLKASANNWKAIFTGDRESWTDVYTEYAKLKQTAESLAKSNQKTKSSNIDLSDSLNKLRDSAKSFAISVRESLSKNADQLADLKKQYDRQTQSIGDSLTKLEKTHKEKLTSISDEIKKSKETLEEANKSSADSYEESLASEVKSHQDNLEQKKKDLADSLAFGKDIDEVKISELQAEILEEEAFLAKHANEVASVQSEMGKDSIDLLKEKYAKEKEENQKSYDEKLTSLKKSLLDELDTYAEQKSKLQQSLDETVTDYEDSLNKITKNFNEQMGSMLATSGQDMDAMKEELKKIGDPDVMAAFENSFGYYSSLVKGFSDDAVSNMQEVENSCLNLNSIFSNNPSGLGRFVSNTQPFSSWGGVSGSGSGGGGGGGGFATGGIVPDTGFIYAHKGEMVLPKDKQGGGSVNFYGPMNISDEADEDRLVEKIRKIFMQDFQNAKLGLY